MFERFTEQARTGVVLAQEEARTLKHNYVGTEHILLGVLREREGVTARILESLGITVERVRATVVRIVGTGEEVTSGQIPFTAHAKNVLELALREAINLGHQHIGVEHIMLGLLREREGVAFRILADFDADPEKIRNEVIRVAAAAPAEPPGHEGGVARPAPSPFVGEQPATPADVELGWRARPIALAALGAAVLARLAFDRAKTEYLEPLEMQVLAHLTLGAADAAQVQPGEQFESLAVALACDHGDLHDAVRILADRRLVHCEDEQDGDERVSITTTGARAVHAWLHQTAPLFVRWPPDHPAADDATG
jgi:hypothetical protein